MPPFVVYLRLGFEHLLDLRGYDHILFIAALCAGCALVRWRELLVLITAFTLGHSISLALATMRLLRTDSGWVEFLIPVTIAVTAATNLIALRTRPDRPRIPAPAPSTARPLFLRARYAVALIFGLIHGLGFSSFLRLALGAERSLFIPLLAFNIGLELAQIVAAGAMLLLALVATRILRLPEWGWGALVSLAAGAVAAWMAAERVPW